MSKTKMLIGIDPDVELSGFAMLFDNKVKLANLSFFDLFDQLKFYKEREVKPVVYVECGYLNKSNWHTKADKSIAFNTRIGAMTGANHEVAKKIIEMCKYLNLECVEVKPTASKMKADYFKKITGIPVRTNQEQRDAYMLIHGR